MSDLTAENFDLCVIGGGPGGYVAAIRAAQLGLKVVCVEKRKTFGGVCLNVGCIPSKALLDSSEHFYHARNKLSTHGVKLSGVSLDLPQMMKRKETVVSQLTGGVAGLLKKNKIEAIHGIASLSEQVKGPIKEVKVTTQEGAQRLLHCKNVILATGSAPTELPFMPFDREKVLSSTEVLSLQKVPERMVVVGGGYIGLEMSSVWSRLGTEVTIVEFQDSLLPMMDADAVRELQKVLQKQGIKFLLSHKCLGASFQAGNVSVNVEKLADQSSVTLDADVVLVSVGRSPFTKGLGLKKAGVELDKRGFIQTDEHLQSTVPGIYAIGDVINKGPMLAHKAEEEGVAVVEHICSQASHVNYDLIPGIVYTWPEIAYVGKTEQQLKADGIAFNKGKFPFMANGRAKAMDETSGFVKILAHKETDAVLGVHIVGPRASDMIAEATAVMEFGGSAEDIARTCHAHPTLSEVMKEAAMDVAGRKIHM